MGSGRWSDDDWKGYVKVSGYSSKSTTEIFNTRLDSSLNPKDVVFRESRDSNDNPNSTPVIIGLDVTGSMSSVLDVIARQGLNTLVTEIYNRKPVTDPHVMCMGIGDADHDEAPLQVTQFEADLRIAQQLEKIWLEMGGGGNCWESYALAWYFAAYHTKTDSFEKRKKKGYLFTIGDEEPTAHVTIEHLHSVMGSAAALQSSPSIEDLLDAASKEWEVFHLIVDEGSHARRYPDRTHDKWAKLLGQRVIHLKDHTKLAEVVVSVIQANEGTAKDDIVKSWDGSTSLVVKDAISDIVKSGTTDGGVVTL